MHLVRSWLVMAGLYVVVWTGLLVARGLAPQENAGGQCEGIGFGCTLTPQDAWTFGLLIVGLPVTAAALVIGTGWIVWRRSDPGVVLRGVVAAVVGLSATAAFVLAYLGIAAVARG